tara:strand:+ start:622 stop:1494 length:873 start_codon:yes stop_codon:yes gene_type:complete
MKKLFEFTVVKKDLVKESETSKNENGEEITTTKEVEKDIDKKYFLRKPTRKLFDDAELFYGVELSKGIKAGLLTRALLQKRFSNDGGTLGEKEREEWGNLYSEIFDKQVELQQLSIIKKRSPAEDAKYENAKEFLKDSRVRVQEFEMQQSSLYDQTAENRARNRTILWWVLHLGHYFNDEEEEKPFFGDSDYEARIDVYDQMEEKEDDHVIECINKFFYYVSFWYVSKTSDPKQFKDLIAFAEQQDLESDEDATEVEFEGDEAQEGAAKEEDPFEDVTEGIPEEPSEGGE